MNLKALAKAWGIFIAAAVVAVVGIALWSCYPSVQTPPKAKEPQLATPAKETTKVQKESVSVSGGKVVVLKKEQVKKEVIIPQEVADNPQKQITAVVTTPPAPAGTEVISVVNTDTGITQIYATPKEPSLFEFVNQKRVGVAYGLSSGGTTLKVFGEWTVIRISKVHIGLQAEATAASTESPSAKGMIFVDYRW